MRGMGSITASPKFRYFSTTSLPFVVVYSMSHALSVSLPLLSPLTPRHALGQLGLFVPTVFGVHTRLQVG